MFTMTTTGHDNDISDASPASTKATGRRVEFDYLRAFVIVLVVWHHAILAYAEYSFINPENPIATFSPVVDLQRWVGFDLLASLNDAFFMPLMFFLSGLFVWRSLKRKGTGKYLSDRLIRLGIPFTIGVLFLIPLAYYPAQLTVELVYGGDTGYMDFWLGMVRSGFNTAGPLWFLWLLLVFDFITTLLHRVIRQPDSVFQGRTISMFERSLVFFLMLLVVSTVAYLPLALTFEPFRWIGIGPFVFQANRILFYLVYFLAGVAIGAYGIDRSILKSGGSLAKRWWAWLIIGLLGYVVLVVLVAGGSPQPLLTSLVFTATCAALVYGVMAFFLRYATRRVGVLDSLAACAYGIYIVHYTIVTWLQYGLLSAELSAIAKALLVFIGTLILSWGVIAALRRIPVVARVI